MLVLEPSSSDHFWFTAPGLGGLVGRGDTGFAFNESELAIPDLDTCSYVGFAFRFVAEGSGFLDGQRNPVAKESIAVVTTSTGDAEGDSGHMRAEFQIAVEVIGRADLVRHPGHRVVGHNALIARQPRAARRRKDTARDTAAMDTCRAAAMETRGVPDAT